MTKQPLPIGFSLVVIIGLYYFAPAYADECDAVLQQGVRNQFYELRKGDFHTAFESEYCGRSSSSQGSSSGQSIGGSYAGYGLSFGSNSADTSQSRSENCGGSNSRMSDANYFNAMKSVADEQIVSAWLACKTTAYGVVINGEINDEDIIVTYKFKAAGAVTQATIDGDPVISGATCDKAVKDGTIINTGGRIQSCKRYGNRAVTIAVNTNFQPARLYIPSAIASERRVPKVEKQDKGPGSDFCKNWKGPGIPIECLGMQPMNRPGM